MPLAPRVILAFDDFSRAGAHALRLAAKGDSHPLPALQSTELEGHVDVWAASTTDQEVSCVVVRSASVPDDKQWMLADALTRALSTDGVQQLTILAAVHLPFAKGEQVVYHATLPGSAAVTDAFQPTGERFLPLDADWQIKDTFLSVLLHLLAVERATRVDLLLAKGYRPGRDLAATYEAVETLTRALGDFTSGQLAVGTTEIQQALPVLLAKDESLASTLSSGSDTLLLYS